MRFLRPNVLEMIGYVPGYQPEDEGWIKLNQNENPYPFSPRVREAIAAEIDRLATYPDSTCRRVREAAASVYKVAPEEVMVSNGSDEMLRILFEAIIAPGDEVVSFYPSYTYYKTLADIQAGRYRLIEFSGDFGLPEKLDLESAKLVFLPNPNAPTGTLFSEGDIARLCAAARSGLVVIDEAYADFAGVSAIPLLRQFDNLFVTRTFSKSYSLAGMRLGLGFGRRELLAQLDKVRDFYNVDRLAQVAAIAALIDQEHLRSTCRRINATRDRLTQGLEKLGVRVLPSQTNFVLARFDEPAAKTVYEQLVERRILVRHFAKPRVDDCLRITIGTEAQTDRLLDALQEILRG